MHFKSLLICPLKHFKAFKSVLLRLSNGGLGCICQSQIMWVHEEAYGLGGKEWEKRRSDQRKVSSRKHKGFREDKRSSGLGEMGNQLCRDSQYYAKWKA
jgi:hypothetical protein